MEMCLSWTAIDAVTCVTENSIDSSRLISDEVSGASYFMLCMTQ